MPATRTRRRTVSCARTAFVVLVAAVACITARAPTALAAGTVLFNQPFHDNTVDGPVGAVATPPGPGGRTNVACLSASGNSTGTPLLSCPSAPDTQGAGTLRLTSADTSLEGGIFAKSSVPTSQGLDVTFNSYQYGGAGGGADGLAFALAAVDPASPASPTTLGTNGGALGYSAFPSSTVGLSHGYLGIALDVHGNFSNPTYEGSGCTDPANMAGRVDGQIAIRGPGNGLVGYCALKSSAATAKSPPLILRAATRAASVVPVEVVYNPSASSVTTPSGLVVPAQSYDVKYTPVGGTAKTLVGALPIVPAGVYPASWVNASGFPKQLAFGWVGSTGSVTDFHEIDSVLVSSLNPVPVLAVSQTSYAAASLSPGDPVTYTVAASSSGATETLPVTVTETLPAGVIPAGASGTGWVCGARVGQHISCTRNASPFTSGTITVNGVVNTTGVTAAAIATSTTAAATSADGDPGTSSSAPAGTIPTTPGPLLVLTPTAGVTGGGNDVKVTGPNLGGATAIEIGTTAEFAAGTPLTEVLCAASASGCFTVIDASTLDISDMPDHLAASPVTVKVVSLGIAASAGYVYAGGPAMLFPDPPSGEVNVAYSDQLTETGGIGPYTWSVSSGTLPAGLTLNASTGLLSGTPTAAAVGNNSFTIKVADSVNQSDTRAVSIPIIAGPALAFPAPPSGWTRTVYGVTLTESGGTAPFTWTVASGSLPAGISLSPTGVLSGTPTAIATSNFTVQVTDADSQSATEAVTLSVADGVRSTGSAPPQADLGLAYSYTASATGGTAPYTWSADTGTLPPGLTFSSAGVLAGTPTAAGSDTFTVNVVDQNGGIDTASITFVVAAAVTTTFGAPPSTDVDAAYSDTLSATGGTGAYAWSISAGSLPAGLTLAPTTGIISGTPTAAVASSFTVTVSDSYGQLATKATTLTVHAALVASLGTPAGGEVGAPYSYQLTKSGGTAPLTWTVSAGSLPAGLSLGSGTGIISGTPSAAGSSSFTIQLADGAGEVVTKAASITVVGGPLLGFPTPPAGKLGTAYSDQLAATSGTPPYVWSVTAGALPAGVTLGAGTGLLAGTPTASGAFSFTVSVTDAVGQLVTQATTLEVTTTVTLSPVVVPEGVITDGVGATYGPLTLTAPGLSGACSGGSPCSWSVSPALPAGLTLSNPNAASASITGVPTAVQTSVMTVTVSQDGVAQATLPLVISDIENLNAGIGAFPTGMVADTRNARVYVAASKSNQVDSINASANPVTATPTLTTLGAGQLKFPDGLAYTPATDTLFASSYASSSAAQASPPATGVPRADPLPGCGEQEGVAQDSGGQDVWVGCFGSGSAGRVAVMTPAGVALGTFVLATGTSSPSGVAPTGTSGHVAVADAAAGKLYTVNTTGVVGAPAVLPATSVPANVAYANVGGTPFDYVADPGTGQFSVVNQANDSAPSVAANVNLPSATHASQPYGIATNGSSVLVVSDSNNASAYVYTLTKTAPYATLQYTIALPSNAIPDGVADMTVAGTNLAFIGNEGGNSVTVIDPPLPNHKAKTPGKPIHLGLLGRLVGRALAGTPRTRALAGHLLYPGPK